MIGFDPLSRLCHVGETILPSRDGDTPCIQVGRGGVCARYGLHGILCRKGCDHQGDHKGCHDGDQDPGVADQGIRLHIQRVSLARLPEHGTALFEVIGEALVPAVLPEVVKELLGKFVLSVVRKRRVPVSVGNERIVPLLHGQKEELSALLFSVSQAVLLVQALCRLIDVLVRGVVSKIIHRDDVDAAGILRGELLCPRLQRCPLLVRKKSHLVGDKGQPVVLKIRRPYREGEQKQSRGQQNQEMNALSHGVVLLSLRQRRSLPGTAQVPSLKTGHTERRQGRQRAHLPLSWRREDFPPSFPTPRSS